MIAGLNESARLVVGNAERLAGQSGAGYIGVEHLFLAVVELGDPAIERCFADCDVDLVTLTESVRSAVGASSRRSAGGMLLTPRARACLEGADRMAGPESGDATAPWVLLAILGDPFALPTRQLALACHHLPRLETALRQVATRWNEAGRLRTEIENPWLADHRALEATLGRDLTQGARDGLLHPVVGREEELLELMAVLLERGRTSPVLVGEAGVGKSALVEGLALRIAEGRVHPDLREKRIRALEMSSLSHGTQDAGSLRERFHSLLSSASADPRLIMFLDDIPQLLGGDRGQTTPWPGVGTDFKRRLVNGDIQCIGTATPRDYAVVVEDDPSLARRLAPIRVPEPSRDVALEILQSLKARYESFHRLQIDDGSLAAAVDLSARYMGDRRLPAKALDVLNRACTEVRLRLWLGDHGELGSLSRDERTALLTGVVAPRIEAPAILTADDVARVVGSWTGIPVSRVHGHEADRLLKLEELLSARVLGQPEAVHAVARAVRTSRAGLGDATRPVGSFLFLGPTGVGKTALGESLADVLFGTRDRMIRVDMSECQSRGDVWRLIGSSAGHVDSARGGLLTEAVKKQPHSVVVFDEVEKAHPAILDLLLQVLDDGGLTDGLGRPVDFRSTVVILTSNVGSERIGAARVFGFPPGNDSAAGAEGVKRTAMREAQAAFRPELLNRLDDIVAFNPLTRDQLRGIAHVMVGRLPVRIDIDDAVAQHLVDVSFNPLWGARPLRRAIRDNLLEPLALERLRGAISTENTVVARMRDGQIVFSGSEGRELSGHP